MNTLNRFVVSLIWFALLAASLLFAAVPFSVVTWVEAQASELGQWLESWQTANPTYFIVAQAAFGIGALLLFGTLIFFEIMTGRRRGVRVRTAEGGSVELETTSIGRRLEWHLDQLAEVITVVPVVKSRGGSVDVRLEIETAPDVDIPLKTDEVVAATREIVEQNMGLKLGKLDVHMRCAPFEPEWYN